MIRQRSLIAFTLLILAAPAALSAQSSDQTRNTAVMQAVEAAFPRVAGEGSQANPDTCAAVFTQNADGTPGLVAASFRGKNVEVAMLAYEQGKARIIDAITDRELFLGGDYCGVSSINLADPADASSLLAKTVRISYGDRDEQDWYFVWNGKKLVNITALDHDPGLNAPNSAMPNSSEVDLDHTGAIQIASANEDGDKFPQDEDGISATGTLTLFRFNGTTYARAKTLQFLDEFTPQPANWSATQGLSWADTTKSYIDMHKTPAPDYKLTLVNGDRDGRNRVTSAKVEINGVVFVSPTEVNQAVETLTRTVQLQKKNTIKVTVEGSPKSHVYVVVE